MRLMKYKFNQCKFSYITSHYILISSSKGDYVIVNAVINCIYKILTEMLLTAKTQINGL